jgi:hypothetical protein
MATIDLTLDGFIVPRMSTFTPPWGTVQTDPDHPGLSTQEAVNNIMMAFNRMRPFVVTENSTTTEIQADSTLLLGGSVASLTLGNASYKGCELKIINEVNGPVSILDGIYTISLEPGDTLELRWNGTDWRVKTDKHVGNYVVQHPDETSPVEAGLAGTWAVWSARSIAYGLSQSAPPPFVDYYSLAGTSITAGATPVVCYHKAGDDFRLYRFIAQTAAYTVPVELDPVKWTYLQPGAIVERQKCGNLLTAEDYEIGHQIPSGTHQGFYVTEVIVPGGKFTGVEGGFRSAFISGGVQEGRIRNIVAYWCNGSTDSVGLSGYGGAYVPEKIQGTVLSETVALSDIYWRNKIDASRLVPTGPDNAPTSLSIRIWRRVA